MSLKRSLRPQSQAQNACSSTAVRETNDNASFQRRNATNDEIKSLRHVVDDIPSRVWLAVYVSAAERFSFFGFTVTLSTSSLYTGVLGPNSPRLLHGQ